MKNTQIRAVFFLSSSSFLFLCSTFVWNQVCPLTHIFPLGLQKRLKTEKERSFSLKRFWKFNELSLKKSVSRFSFAYVLVKREKFQFFSWNNCNWIKSWQCNWWWKVDVQDSIFALEWPSSSLKRYWQNTFHR